MKLLPTILSAFLLITTLSGKSDMNTPVIPMPQSVQLLDGATQFNNNLIISISSSKLQFTAELVRETLKQKSGVNYSITENSNGKIKLILTDSPIVTNDKTPDPGESYELKINDNEIEIKSSTPKGIFYGAMSLIQLVENSEGNSIDNMLITDWPDLKIRGISDDISRGQVSTLENFKRIIEFLARYKMNTYMPYIEDMLQFESYPTIGRGRGALTKDEVRELVNYAAKYYVEVIPIFQTLGHYENILNQEEFLEYAEFPGSASLCVIDDDTYDFLETMLEEVFELFPSKYFHMGADESYDVGLGRSKELVEQSSIADVHLEHYKKVYKICKDNGKEVMMYGDIILGHPEILEGLPKDITIVDWHYRPDFDYRSTIIFKEAGFDYIVSPTVWNFATSFPANTLALPNIKYITQSGIKNNSIGMINSNWGDYGAETFKELILYGYAWSAQCAWSYNESNLDQFTRIFMRDFFGTDDPAPVEIYETLGDPYNQIIWHNVWRHPLLPYREPALWTTSLPAAAHDWMKKSNSELYRLIAQLKSTAARNKDHIRILEFILNLNEWYVQKLYLQNYLHAALNLEKIESQVDYMESQPDAELQKKIAEGTLAGIDLPALIEECIAGLRMLKISFREVWLTYYKPENLNMIEDKFDRQIQYLEETLSALNNDELHSPEITSQWIYCSADSGKYEPAAEFEKKFTINGKVDAAKLQLLGDTHAKLYINDKFVAEVYARRSLSLIVDYKRIKYIDITNLINEGENQILVQVLNYNRTPEAGFNLIAEVKSSDGGTQYIRSDESWICRPLNDGNRNWEKAISKPYRFTVIEPNFETNRTSWIER